MHMWVYVCDCYIRGCVCGRVIYACECERDVTFCMKYVFHCFSKNFSQLCVTVEEKKEEKKDWNITTKWKKQQPKNK